MKKIVLTCGLISGTIVATVMAISMAFYNSGTSNDYGMLVGYASMILSFSLIFVAIKSYRDKNDGKVTFGKALTIGLLVSLIASTMYVVTWAIEYHYFMPDFMDKYFANTLKAAEKTGNAAKIAAVTKQIQQGKAMYANPISFVGITYMEILPVGILVSAIAAAILKKKSDTPASA
jgi:hypothetical protein